MGKKLDTELLYLASKEILSDIKNEAVDNLKSLHESENIVNNKATGLLQVLFPVFVGIFGFIINEMSNNKTSKLLFFSSLLEIVIFISCFYLFDILVLKKVALVGFKPSNILEKDIVEDTENENHLQYLRIKVFSLQNAIEKTQESNTKRAKSLQNALNILIIGTASIAITFLLYHLACGLFLRT